MPLLLRSLSYESKNIKKESPLIPPRGKMIEVRGIMFFRFEEPMFLLGNGRT